MARVGKTSSTSRGPLSVGDGVERISSVIISLVSGMEARAIETSRSMIPKAPSNVSMREDVLHPARAILIFHKPLHFSLAAFSSK